MRVNSTFNGLFTNQSVVRSGIAIVMLTIFFIGSSFTTHPDPDLRAKQVNLIIRQIGHRLLQQAGDSTSIVLPVTETKEGTFLLQFEKEFLFSHDSLMTMSQGLLPKTEFPSGYTVTVHDCMTASIVYGFQFNNTSPDLLPCSGRTQAPGCYTIEFTFPDFYEPVEAEPPKIDQATEEPKTVKIDQEARAKSEEVKKPIVDNGTNQLTEELKSFKVDRQEANQKRGESKTTITTSDFPSDTLVYSGILVLLAITFLIGRFGKSSTPMPFQDQNKIVIKESAEELASLGRFLFDGKRQRLLLDTEVIRLTDKECKILELFIKNFGELIPRDTLMQEVWINDGVITGRSLDMFVSKLRKKLSGDPELRITNVHGKGYRLELAGVAIC